MRKKSLRSRANVAASHDTYTTRRGTSRERVDDALRKTVTRRVEHDDRPSTHRIIHRARRAPTTHELSTDGVPSRSRERRAPHAVTTRPHSRALRSRALASGTEKSPTPLNRSTTSSPADTSARATTGIDECSGATRCDCQNDLRADACTRGRALRRASAWKDRVLRLRASGDRTGLLVRRFDERRQRALRFRSLEARLRRRRARRARRPQEDRVADPTLVNRDQLVRSCSTKPEHSVLIDAAAKPRARPSPVPDVVTSTSRSRPAIRRKCSRTSADFHSSCAGLDACWRSHPPHPPG